VTAPVSNEPFGEIQEARWLDPASPPLGRLVFLGDVGVDAGGGWGAFAVGDERGARTLKGPGAFGRPALVPDDVG